MFGRQICSRCGKKTSKKYDFCPSCGYSLKGKESFFEPAFKMGFPFNAIIKQLEKQISKEFRAMDSEMPSFLDEEKKRPNAQGISINISSGNGQPIIRVKSLGNERAEDKKEVKENVMGKTLSEEDIIIFSKLPKEEPSTNIRRLTNKIVYEIDLPYVKKENIMVTKFQNSIEIKAFTKDKAFFKLIPISLPILKSQLKEGKLILELKPAI